MRCHLQAREACEGPPGTHPEARESQHSAWEGRTGPRPPTWAQWGRCSVTCYGSPGTPSQDRCRLVRCLQPGLWPRLPSDPVGCPVPLESLVGLSVDQAGDQRPCLTVAFWASGLSMWQQGTTSSSLGQPHLCSAAAVLGTRKGRDVWPCLIRPPCSLSVSFCAGRPGSLPVMGLSLTLLFQQQVWACWSSRNTSGFRASLQGIWCPPGLYLSSPFPAQTEGVGVACCFSEALLFLSPLGTSG